LVDREVTCFPSVIPSECVLNAQDYVTAAFLSFVTIYYVSIARTCTLYSYVYGIVCNRYSKHKYQAMKGHRRSRIIALLFL